MRRAWFGLRQWLVWVWEHVPFVRRGGGPGLAGVREPRRPRPPFRPPQAMFAEPEAASVVTLTRVGRLRRLWRGRPWRDRSLRRWPHAGPGYDGTGR